MPLTFFLSISVMKLLGPTKFQMLIRRKEYKILLYNANILPTDRDYKRAKKDPLNVYV